MVRNVALAVAALVVAAALAFPVVGGSEGTELASGARVDAGSEPGRDLGEFLVTCYSADDNLTESGAPPGWGTVAVDPATIPLGSRLIIQGFDDTVFTADDTGGRINGRHIDMWHPDADWCRDWGREERDVTLLESG